MLKYRIWWIVLFLFQKCAIITTLTESFIDKIFNNYINHVRFKSKTSLFFRKIDLSSHLAKVYKEVVSKSIWVFFKFNFDKSSVIGNILSLLRISSAFSFSYLSLYCSYFESNSFAYSFSYLFKNSKYFPRRSPLLPLTFIFFEIILKTSTLISDS